MAEGKYVIDGFIFNNKADYLQAKNEYDGVAYMRSRTNTNNAANVYSVYKSLVEKGVFERIIVLSNRKGVATVEKIITDGKVIRHY